MLFSKLTEATPESSEEGEFSDNGFLWGEDGGSPCSFRELVDYIKNDGFVYWSNSDQTGWLSTGFDIIDYSDLIEQEKSLHPQNDRSLRYLKKAFDYVNPKV